MPVHIKFQERNLAISDSLQPGHVSSQLHQLHGFSSGSIVTPRHMCTKLHKQLANIGSKELVVRHCDIFFTHL